MPWSLRQAVVNTAYRLRYGPDTDKSIALNTYGRPIAFRHPAAEHRISLSVHDAERLAALLRTPIEIERDELSHVTVRTRAITSQQPCLHCARPFWEEQQAVDVFRSPWPHGTLIHRSCAPAVAERLDSFIEVHASELLGDAL